jgi:thioredoxin 1
MTSTHVNEQNFEAEVMKADKLVLIDFYADWCGPCKNLAPRIEEFAAEHPEV